MLGDVDLTTDNAAVGALRRGGLLGVGAFLVGLWLSGTPRRSPQGSGVVPRDRPRDDSTIAVADWLLGGTGWTIWILLVASETWLCLGNSRPAAADEPVTDPC